MSRPASPGTSARAALRRRACSARPRRSIFRATNNSRPAGHRQSRPSTSRRQAAQLFRQAAVLLLQRADAAAGRERRYAGGVLCRSRHRQGPRHRDVARSRCPTRCSARQDGSVANARRRPANCSREASDVNAEQREQTHGRRARQASRLPPRRPEPVAAVGAVSRLRCWRSAPSCTCTGFDRRHALRLIAASARRHRLHDDRLVARRHPRGA